MDNEIKEYRQLRRLLERREEKGQAPLTHIEEFLASKGHEEYAKMITLK